MTRTIFICLILVLVAGCDSMTREETIAAIKQCEDAGLEAKIYRRLIHDGSIARIDCDIKRQPSN